MILRKYPNGIVLSEGFANVGWHIHLMQATGWALLPATGYWMIFKTPEGIENVGLHVHIMQTIGIVMIGRYLTIRLYSLCPTGV